MKKQNDTPLAIGITLFVLLIGVILLVTSYFSRKVTMNPPETVGNTAGNLNNYGLFCETEDTIYFANSYDSNCLYAMNADETNLRKISNVIVCNLVSGGDYLYYFQRGTAGKGGLANVVSNICYSRYHLKRKTSTALTKDVIVCGQLTGNTLYLLASTNAGPRFYKLCIDGSNRVDLATYTINPSCVVDGTIYYNGTKDNHYLYALNTQTDVPSILYEKSLWFPIVYGEYVYYMDVENNYRLCRYSFASEQEEVLTEDRIDCFNIGSGYIYYQKNDAVTPQLKCMRTDGSNVTVIAEGNYTRINMTSQYVYFQEFNDKYNTYHTRIGSASYQRFSAAEELAFETTMR